MEQKDKIVAQLQDVVKAKKAEIAKIEKPNYRTNLSLNLSGQPVNLNTVNSVTDLTILLSRLISAADSYDKAAKLIGTKEPFKHQGHTLEDWTYDLVTRAGKLSILEKKAELEEVEKRLSKLESKELREQRELDELTRLLGGE